MEEDFKLTSPEFQVKLLRRMGYKRNHPDVKIVNITVIALVMIRNVY